MTMADSTTDRPMRPEFDEQAGIFPALIPYFAFTALRQVKRHAR